MDHLEELESLAQPNTLEEWESYIHTIPRNEIWSKACNVNTHAFARILLAERVSMKDIEAIVLMFVRRLSSLEVKIPEGGAFDMVGMFKDDPLSQEIARTWDRQDI